MIKLVIKIRVLDGRRHSHDCIDLLSIIESLPFIPIIPLLTNINMILLDLSIDFRRGKISF